MLTVTEMRRVGSPSGPRAWSSVFVTKFVTSCAMAPVEQRLNLGRHPNDGRRARDEHPAPKPRVLALQLLDAGAKHPGLFVGDGGRDGRRAWRIHGLLHLVLQSIRGAAPAGWLTAYLSYEQQTPNPPTHQFW
jgi:hypothetical protein